MQNRNISTAFMKGLDLLMAYRDGPAGMTLAELSKRTGMDRATVRRLCLTLTQAGFMVQVDRVFQLSPRVLTLGGSFLAAQDIGHAVQPVLNAFSERVGGEITLAVRDGDRALYVASSSTVDARISFGLTVGSTLPLLSTAVGRMILASLPGSERSALLAELPLEAFTEQTCLDRAVLAREIDSIAASGVSVVNGEYEAGICGIAVPIGPPSQVRGVLGSTLPLSLTDLAGKQAETIFQLQQAATALSKTRSLVYALQSA